MTTDRVFLYGVEMNAGYLGAWLSEHGFDAAGLGKPRLAALPGYRIVWNVASDAGGVPNLAAAVGRELFGALVEVDDAALAALDRRMGHPDFFTRGDRRFAVRTGDGTYVDAWVYTAARQHCRTGGAWPSREILDRLLEGARQLGIPQWQQRELDSTPTR